MLNGIVTWENRERCPMAKKFEALRSRMQPEARARAEEEANKMLARISAGSVGNVWCEEANGKKTASNAPSRSIAGGAERS